MSAQDGKPDHSGLDTQPVSESRRGTIMFTLCLEGSAAAQGAGGIQRRHAIAPFPETYDDACKDALRIFAPFLPHNTEAVSLRVARESSGGRKVWCIVNDKDWGAVVQRKGDECGVFPPDATPDRVPYTVDINNAAESMRGDLTAHRVKYDMRMVGRPEMVEEYLGSRCDIVVGNACLGDVNDMDTVRYLAGLFSGPLMMYVV